MVHSDQLIVTLIHAFAGARSLSVSYASRLLTGSGDTVDRVTAGASITARRAETILRRASQSWPADRPWPADIPRPAPADDDSQDHRERAPASLPTSPCPPPPSRAAGPDGATAPRAAGAEPSERSERPATEGNERVGRGTGGGGEPRNEPYRHR